MKEYKIVYFITGLSLGGAEKFLSNYLVNYSDPKKTIIICLTKKGKISKILESKKFKIYYLNFNIFFFSSFIKIFKKIKKFNPNFFSAFMYHSFIIAIFYSIFFKNLKVFFFIRSSINKISDYKFLTQLVIYLCLFISNKASKIIYNSKKSLQQHVKLGFDKKKSIYLPNGFIIKDFLIKYKKKNNLSIRKKYKISSDTIIIGHVTRYHEMKNTELLVKAFDKIISNKKIILMIIGRNHKKSEYFKIFKNKKNKKIILIDEVNELNRFISCFNFHVSASSKIEGFSNVTAECMLMNVPCIATDVGDAKQILSNFGILIKPNNFNQLFNSIKIMIKKNNQNFNIKIFQPRKYIEKHYNMDNFNKNYIKNFYLKKKE